LNIGAPPLRTKEPVPRRDCGVILLYYGRDWIKERKIICIR
jgi:hypothetical protein